MVDDANENAIGGDEEPVLAQNFPQISIGKFFEWLYGAEVVLSELQITDDRP